MKNINFLFFTISICISGCASSPALLSDSDISKFKNNYTQFLKESVYSTTRGIDQERNIVSKTSREASDNIRIVINNFVSFCKINNGKYNDEIYKYTQDRGTLKDGSRLMINKEDTNLHCYVSKPLMDAHLKLSYHEGPGWWGVRVYVSDYSISDTDKSEYLNNPFYVKDDSIFSKNSTVSEFYQSWIRPLLSDLKSNSSNSNSRKFDNFNDVVNAERAVKDGMFRFCYAHGGYITLFMEKNDNRYNCRTNEDRFIGELSVTQDWSPDAIYISLSQHDSVAEKRSADRYAAEQELKKAADKAAKTEKQKEKQQFEQKLSASIKAQWVNRLTAKYQKGDKVCTYKNNYFGYVNEITSNKLNVYVVGYAKTVDGFYFNCFKCGYPITKVEAQRWYGRDEIAPCEFDFDTR
jgi:hypothetical protein